MLVAIAQQMLSELTKARARVEHDELAVRPPKLDARGVAAIPHRARTRRGDRAARPPETQAEGDLTDATLVAFGQVRRDRRLGPRAPHLLKRSGQLWQRL